MAEDEIDINPRSANESGRRLIVLASLIRHDFLGEHLAFETLSDEVADERFDLAAWLTDQELQGDLTPDEHQAFEVSGVVRPASDALAPAAATTAIGWYVGLIPQLPELLDVDSLPALIDLVPAPWDPVVPWLDELKTRSLQELADQRELAELRAWRLEIELERRQSTGSDVTEIEQAISATVAEAIDAKLIPQQTLKDFNFNGVSCRDLGGEELEALRLESTNRLRALNWLSGYGESWSDVPLDI